ncbi:hypothetical protein [Conexibacter sp. CPCC 206217]|uniref:hypothetical protein n=1 Tax=Conexibacter sp. CPCC 206217 TaxID=3064574 RepID=UPI00271BD750|nr:hypothetical protein [Conexibacter sp. CPCC 206217]MDO8211624.1 hypothetical protein [Conexibacter sp. CPCC 206217]
MLWYKQVTVNYTYRSPIGNVAGVKRHGPNDIALRRVVDQFSWSSHAGAPVSVAVDIPNWAGPYRIIYGFRRLIPRGRTPVGSLDERTVHVAAGEMVEQVERERAEAAVAAERDNQRGIRPKKDKSPAGAGLP